MTRTIKPMKPCDIIKTEQRRNYIFYAVNEAILASWDGSCAKVNQTEVGRRIAKMMDITFDDVCKNKYMDIDNEYRQAGWKVTSHHPGICEEHFDPYWLFKEDVAK